MLKLETLGWIEIISLGSLPCSPLPSCLRGGAALSRATSRPWLNPKSGRSDKGAPATQTIRMWLARCPHQYHQTAVHKAPSPASVDSWVRQTEAVPLVYNLVKRMMMHHGCSMWSFSSQAPFNYAGHYPHDFTIVWEHCDHANKHVHKGSMSAYHIRYIIKYHENRSNAYKRHQITRDNVLCSTFSAHRNTKGQLSKRPSYQNDLSWKPLKAFSEMPFCKPSCEIKNSLILPFWPAEHYFRYFLRGQLAPYFISQSFSAINLDPAFI